MSNLGRLLCSQANNSAIFYRLSIGKQKGILKDLSDLDSENHMYLKIRNDVSRGLTFACLARGLAKDFEEYMLFLENSHDGTEARVKAPLKPMYTKNAFSKYNSPSGRQRRL